MTDGKKGPEIILEDLGIDENLVSFLSKEWGISELFPPQAEAVPIALSGENILLAIPTASGKSLVAYITMIQRLKGDLKGLKGLYIVPLKALASEKFEELRSISREFGLKIGMAVGDRNSETKSVEDFDILVCTSEKLDSMLRSRPSMVNNIGIVVADEFHLIQDPSRGPTLEIILSMIMHRKPEAQLLALSATVGNAQELAEWLGAKLIISEWRPVTLYQGTMTGLKIKFHKVESRQEGDSPLPEERVLQGGVNKNLHALLEDSIESRKQLLVFVSSRSSAQKEARDLSKHVNSMKLAGSPKISDKMEAGWKKMTADLTKRGEISKTVKSLSNTLGNGVAFHHAGLTYSQRKIVEDNFRNGKLLCVVATPTLAQGVNLPASRVVVRDTRRWSTIASRRIPLPVMEIRQMMGRSGRPGFDEFGESLLISKSNEEEGSLVELYFKGELEKLSSKLANPSALRVEEDGALLTHILSIIATAGIDDRDSIARFLNKTFLATQINSENLEIKIDDVICWLVRNGMIERTGESEEVKKRISEMGTEDKEDDDWDDDVPSWAESALSVPGLALSSEKRRSLPTLGPRKGPAFFGFRRASRYEASEQTVPEPYTMTYSPTSLGSRIARLYLNPISGRIIHDGLNKAMQILTGDDNVGQISPISLVHLAACTPDFLPLWPRKTDYDTIQNALISKEREFLTNSVDLEEESRMKGVLVIESWMEECSVEWIEENWGVQPGDLRGRVELIGWLLYAARRILSEDRDFNSMSIDSHRLLVDLIDESRRRVRFGCKSDILSLVSIRGVGRIRAREMVKVLGISSASDLLMLTEKDEEKLANLRGWSMKLVQNIVDSARNNADSSQD